MLNKIIFNLIFLLIIFFNNECISQSISLKEKVVNIEKLFLENIDIAFEQTNYLLDNAISDEDFHSQLKLIEIRCKYFYSKRKLDLLLIEAKSLKNKSLNDNYLYFHLIANIYIAEVYSMNALFIDSIKYLEENLKLIEGIDPKIPSLFIANANTLTSLANLYNDSGEYEKSAQTLKTLINKYNLLTDKKDVSRFQYVNYSNLANVYLNFNIDSSDFYVRKSIALKGIDLHDKIEVNNLIVLGKIYKEKGDLNEALKQFKLAEKISLNLGEKLNIDELYKNLVDIYIERGNDTLVVLANNELLKTEFENLKNKNNALHQIINDKNEMTFDYNILFYGLSFLLVVISILWFLLWFNKKGPNSVSNNIDFMLPTPENLIEMVKENNPNYMFSFDILYPDFKKNILKIDPSISVSEIEFCSLLKLNLSTKQISQLKCIEIRTVQNKKYIIRKKLNIPTDMDLYVWFNLVV